MPIIKDLTGSKFGKLTVIQKAPVSGDHSMYLCQCDCGKQITVRGSSLTNGHTTSCGCNRPKSITQNLAGDYQSGTQLSQLRSNPSKRNSSGVVGVCWNKRSNKWGAYITFRGVRYDLGLYENFEEAVDARKKAEERFWGNAKG